MSTASIYTIAVPPIYNYSAIPSPTIPSHPLMLPVFLPLPFPNTSSTSTSQPSFPPMDYSPSPSPLPSVSRKNITHLPSSAERISWLSWRIYGKSLPTTTTISEPCSIPPHSLPFSQIITLHLFMLQLYTALNTTTSTDPPLPFPHPQPQILLSSEEAVLS